MFLILVESKGLPTKPFNKHVLTSLEVANYSKFNNTAKLFKKLTFIGLALSNVLFNRYKTLTIRSVMASLWNMIATYITIF